MRALFVGCGSIGCRHIRNLSTIAGEDDFPLVVDALRSTNAPLPADILPLVTNVHRSWDSVSDEYDAVFVTNPTGLHGGVIEKTAGRAGAFFVEKPVTSLLGEARDLAERYDSSSTYYVACPLRYSGVLQDACQTLRGKRVLSVQSISSSYLPGWRPGQDYRKTYCADLALGGGVRLDLIHEWDYLTWMFGFPDEVIEMSGRLSSLEINSEDVAAYVGRYPGMMVEVHLDYFGRMTIRQMRAMTDNNTYLFDIANGRTYCDGEPMRSFAEDPNEKYLREIRAFLRIARGETENVNDLSHAARVMSICLGAPESR